MQLSAFRSAPDLPPVYSSVLADFSDRRHIHEPERNLRCHTRACKTCRSSKSDLSHCRKFLMVIASQLQRGMAIRIEEKSTKFLKWSRRLVQQRLVEWSRRSRSTRGLAGCGSLISDPREGRRCAARTTHHGVPVFRRQQLYVHASGQFRADRGSDRGDWTSSTVLRPGEEIPIEFFANQPISAVLPDVEESRVSATAPASRSPQDSAWKDAILDNGLVIRLPLFIAPGETVRVDVRTRRYFERTRTEHKRSA